MQSKMEMVAVDIGGTHARFSIAEIHAGKVAALDEAVTLNTADHPNLAAAWRAFSARVGRPLPGRAGIAVACPVSGDVLKMTNNPWVIQRSRLKETLGLDDCLVINDFGAVSHAVLQVDDGHLCHLLGPDVALPDDGVISIVGPGTGLGVGHVLRRDGSDHVIECEGGHVAFAPVDPIEDAILDRLRRRYGRVSVERVVSGPGLANIYEALAAIEGRAIQLGDEKALWTTALEGGNSLAAAALERFCMCLGAVAGDFALALGASAVVIAGGLGRRLREVLPRSGFGARFVAKGRFENLMAQIPVKLITHPEPGLYGAAAAYAAKHHS